MIRKEDRTGLRQNHRYLLPGGRYAVAIRYWDAASGEDAPYAGWCLMVDDGVNHFVTLEGAVTTFAPAKPLSLSEVVDVGAQPWCSECVFGYDASCHHRMDAGRC